MELLANLPDGVTVSWTSETCDPTNDVTIDKFIADLSEVDLTIDFTIVHSDYYRRLLSAFDAMKLNSFQQQGYHQCHQRHNNRATGNQIYHGQIVLMSVRGLPLDQLREHGILHRSISPEYINSFKLRSE
jgi:hypothetical protein